MPQLDPLYFVSQIFWLAIFFTILYFALNKVFLRKMDTLLEERESYINRAIKKAEQAKIEAEKLKADYQAKLDYARKTASMTINEAMKKLEAEAKENHAEYEKNFSEIQKEADKRIREFKIKTAEEIKKTSTDLAIKIIEELTEIKVDRNKIEKIVEENRITMRMK